MLFYSGSAAENMYLIVDGSISIFVDIEMNDCVVTLYPSAVVGERAFQSNEKFRSKTAKADCLTKCLLLSKEDFICKI